MDYKSELSELAKNIESVVCESLASLKLEETKKQVNSAIDRAIDEMQEALERAGNRLEQRGEQWSRDRENYMEGMRQRTVRKQDPSVSGQADGGMSLTDRYAKRIPDIGRMTPSQLLRYSQIPVCKNPAGQVSGVLYTIFGGSGLIVFGVSALFCLFSLPAETFPETVGATAAFTALAAGNGFLLSRGIFLRGRVKRFYRYLRIINNRTYCDVREIVSSQARKAQLVLKDLRAMIRLNMFREGHLDETGSTLMLTDSTYQEYLAVKDQREQEERLTREEQALAGEDPLLAELKATVEEGRRNVELIRKANEEISGEEVSQKLYRLEDITRKIFEHIQNHPQKLSDIRKFMSYYLPTAMKLVHVYCELERQPVSGENIAAAKADIERTLDTLNVAFENLLDGLFEETAMDISTDISVLETMLTQEGLTGTGFDTRKEEQSI